MIRGTENVFPIIVDTEGIGLTKREHFAAMALQGLLANATYFEVENMPETDAKLAVEYADLLIAALNK